MSLDHLLSPPCATRVMFGPVHPYRRQVSAILIPVLHVGETGSQ